jgi:hypothetical protein
MVSLIAIGWVNSLRSSLRVMAWVSLSSLGRPLLRLAYQK